MAVFTGSLPVDTCSCVSLQVLRNFTHFLRLRGPDSAEIRAAVAVYRRVVGFPGVAQKQILMVLSFQDERDSSCSTSTRWSTSSSCWWSRFHSPLCARQVLAVTGVALHPPAVGQVVDAPVVVQRQVLWSRKPRTPSGSAAVAVFSEVVVSPVVVQRQIPLVVHSAVSVLQQGCRRACVHAAKGSSCPSGQLKFLRSVPRQTEVALRRGLVGSCRACCFVRQVRMGQTVQKIVEVPQLQLPHGFGRRCDMQRQVPGSSRRCLRPVLRQCHDDLRSGVLPQFCGLFELRPAGRECPFFSPRRPTVVGCRGLGGDGDAGGLTPSCSVTLIRCKRPGGVSTKTYPQHSVRTTTTTSVPILAQVADNHPIFRLGKYGLICAMVGCCTQEL